MQSDTEHVWPFSRLELRDACSFGATDARWKACLLDALIVYITAGMVMTLPDLPDDDVVIADLARVAGILEPVPGQVRVLHEAARQRVGGDSWSVDDPGRWLLLAAALAGFWIRQPIGGPGTYQHHELTTLEALERARPVVDFFYGNVLTPEAAGWLFGGE